MWFQRIAVILPGSRRSLPRFIYYIVLTMPYEAWEPAFPLGTHLPGYQRIAKPAFNEFALTLKLDRTFAGIRSISRHSSETRIAFVVWAPDIATRTSSPFQVFIV